MEPKIAIHYRKEGWSDRWIQYCDEHGVSHEIVDCYSTSIIQDLKKFNGLLWDFVYWLGSDLLMARHVLLAAEQMGLYVFPNVNTCWHYDDKIAQKYALESIDAPLVTSYVFYNQQDALAWLFQADYPIVAKLRRGAGSHNVCLLESYPQASRYCKRMFSKGFSPIPRYFADITTKLRRTRDFTTFIDRLKRIPAFISILHQGRKFIPKENGYVLFQQFISGNTYDTRITVVGNRAWGFTRAVRKNDWRASGSGSIDYDLSKISLACVKTAFDISNAFQSQSLAFDFVQDTKSHFLITEISYGYISSAVYNCPGYWNPELIWHRGHIYPEYAIIEDFIQTIVKR